MLQTACFGNRNFVLLFLVFLQTIAICGCGLDVEDPNPPSKPIWVNKSEPEVWPEHGIDAYETGGIALEWLSSPEEDIAGYHVLRARLFMADDSVGQMEEIAFVDVADLTEMVFTDETAPLLIYHGYSLIAEDKSQNLSEPSDTIQYRLLQHIPIDLMRPNGISDALGVERELTWHYNYGEEMSDYTITVLNQQNELLVRQRFNPGNYVGSLETWQIPVEIVLNSGIVYKWRIDTGAAYKNGVEMEGSESAWATFLYSE